MGILPMSLPLTPANRVKRIALTLPSHLRLVFQHPTVTDLKPRFSPFRRIMAAARGKHGISRKNRASRLEIAEPAAKAAATFFETCERKSEFNREPGYTFIDE